MPNKKLAFIINHLEGGGAEKVVIRLSQALAERGHEIHIILLENKIDYTTSTDYFIHKLTTNATGKVNLPIRGSILGFSINDYALAKKLNQCVRKLSKDRPFDLIISTLHKASYITYLAKLPKIAPVYYRVCNTFSKQLQEMRVTKSNYKIKRFLKRVHKIYDQQLIIGISQGVCDDFMQHFSAKNIQTINNPFDYDEINQLATETITDIPQDDYIIHVGRFARAKRHDWLFQAMQQLPTSHKLVLLTKSSPALLEMVEKFNLSQRVIIPGFQKNPYPWIKQAKLLVLSSEWEGFGNVIVEALACATPVVSTNCPSGPSEILTDALAHWLVPVDDPQALNQKIQEALQADIKINPKNLEKFSSDTICKEYLALCN